MNEMRDWLESFPSVQGRKGEVLNVSLKISEEGQFQGEKIVATDFRPKCWYDWMLWFLPMFVSRYLMDQRMSTAGYRTRIRQLRVDGNPVFVGNHGILTAFFGTNALGNGLQFRAPAGANIVAEVEFLEDATWMASIFGKQMVRQSPPSA